MSKQIIKSYTKELNTIVIDDDNIAEVNIGVIGEKLYSQKYNEYIELTKEKIQNWIKNFKEKITGFQLSGNLEHNHSLGKFADVLDVYIRDNKAYAKIKALSDEAKAIIKRFSYISPEYNDNYRYVNGEKIGQEAGSTLLGIAFTNTPQQPGLEAVKLSAEDTDIEYRYYNNNNMEGINMSELIEVLKKENADLKKQLSAIDSAKIESQIKELSQQVENKDSELKKLIDTVDGYKASIKELSINMGLESTDNIESITAGLLEERKKNVIEKAKELNIFSNANMLSMYQEKMDGAKNLSAIQSIEKEIKVLGEAMPAKANIAGSGNKNLSAKGGDKALEKLKKRYWETKSETWKCLHPLETFQKYGIVPDDFE